MMGLPKPKELRRHGRCEAQRLPGVLLNASTNETIPCEAVDVSREGIGIVSNLWIPPQIDVLLVIGSRRLELEIVWGVEKRPSPAWAKKDTASIEEKVYRYGLRLTQPDSDLDLTKLFEDEGCIG